MGVMSSYGCDVVWEAQGDGLMMLSKEEEEEEEEEEESTSRLDCKIEGQLSRTSWLCAGEALPSHDYFPLRQPVLHPTSGVSLLGL